MISIERQRPPSTPWTRGAAPLDLWQAGQRYGDRVGPQVAQVFVLAVTMAAGAGTAGGTALLASRMAMLPSFTRVAAASASGLGINLAGLGQVSAVTVLGSTVVISLPAAAVAMTATGPGAARGANAAYEIAKAGGKHAGTLRNYAGRSTAEIQKAIRGYEGQVALHQQKIANPARFAERWAEMSAEQRAGLIRHWQRDLARNQELAEVLRGLLGSR